MPRGPNGQKRLCEVIGVKEVPTEHVPTRMSPDGFKALLCALAAPSTAVPEMVELARRAAPWGSA
jgi:hypothetical protein